MKFLHKHRRIIGFILTVTVSVMLFVSSIPASAADSVLCRFKRFDSGGSSYTPVTGCNNYSINYTSSGFYGKLYFYDEDIFSFSKTSAPEFFRIIVSLPMGYEKYYKTNIAVGIIYGNNRISRLLFDKIELDPNNINYELYYFILEGQDFIDIANDYNFSSMTVQGVSVDIDSVAASSSSVKRCTVESVTYSTGSSSSSIQKEANRYLFDNFLDPAFKWLGNFISEAFRFVSDNFIVPAIGTLGVIFQDAFDALKPFLSSLLDNLFLPVLNSILSTLNGIVQAIADAFLPIIADIINFFAPYYNKLSDIITNNFIDLVSRLSPLVNQFVTAITPSFESIVNNISKNISNIIRECFIPNDSSAEYQEFVSMKNDVTNKFPIFNQLYSFVSALFNPSTYSPGTSVSVTNILRSYNDRIIESNKQVYYRCNYDFKKGNSYYITFNVSGSREVGIQYVLSSGSYMGGPEIHNGANTILLSESLYSVSAFEFYSRKSSGTASITDICLYSVDSSAGSDFTVNVYGKNVSVLNFDWYMPYKHYGDICVIAFCYLAFVWHTFKRLPQII